MAKVKKVKKRVVCFCLKGTRVPDTIEFKEAWSSDVYGNVITIACGYCGKTLEYAALSKLAGIKLRAVIMAERANNKGD